MGDDVVERRPCDVFQSVYRCCGVLRFDVSAERSVYQFYQISNFKRYQVLFYSVCQIRNILVSLILENG